MKKILFVLCLAAIAMVAVYGTADAAVGGTCVGCHTMHNSQGGVTMNGQAAGRDNLLKRDCVGCHTGNVITAAPQVDGSWAGGATAGGDFGGSAFVATDQNVHNVDLLNTLLDSVGADGTLNNTPPGGSVLASQLGCAGTAGCHGNPTGSHNSITGYHHDSSAPYRFLYASSATTATPVAATGEPTYEAGGATQTKHNLYDADGTNTISTFCARCHGNFHGSGNTNSASPFVRHPTDEEAAVANVDGAGFTPTSANINETPFGFATATLTGMTVSTNASYTSANGYAICVSCHRAHGSNQDDLLRFVYSSMNTNSGTSQGGCETCHVDQQ